MFFFNKQSLSKMSFISGSIATVLFMTGCDKIDAAAADKDVVDTVVVKTPAEPVTATNTEAATNNSSGKIITDMTASNINTAFFGTLLRSDNLSEKQKNCLESRDKDLGKSEIHAFYNANFTAAELKNLEDFYSSATGKTITAYANEQLTVMSGGEVANPMAPPSQDEMVEFQTFMQSPLGMKHRQINEDTGEGSMVAELNPIIDAEFKRCNVDIEMADLT